MADTIQFSIVIGGVTTAIQNVAQLDKIIKQLSQDMVLTSNTATRLQKALELSNAKALRSQMLGVGSAMGGMTNQTAQAGVALQNLNFVIRDSPYFFKDLQLGVLAVGNNINPLIDSFQRLKIQAAAMTAETGKAISAFSLLKQSLAGPLGLSVAMSVLVTAIQAVVFAMAKSKREAKETAKEIDGLTSAIKAFLDIKMPTSARVFPLEPEELDRVIEKTKEQLAEIDAGLTTIEMKKSYGSSYWNDNIKKAGEEYGKNKEELESTKKILEELLEQFNKEKRAREILKKLGLEEVNKHKDKNRSLKQQAAWERQITVEYEKRARLGKLLVPETAEPSPGGRSTPSGSLGEVFADATKEQEKFLKSLEKQNLELETSRIIGRQLGSVLQDAFQKGTIALKQFLESLVVATGQMLILKAVTGQLFLGGGSPATAASASPSASTIFTKRSTLNVNVQGKLRANSREFIADFRRAERIVTQ